MPVVRKNLSEGLYIMLDENLGGGVSLQKNIESLPAAMRPRILEARRTFERDVLLTPVLAALERGNDLQREAVLAAFDGSFFKGRSFARQPEAMIDVGNDREFGFLYQPDLSALETAFHAALGRRAARARRGARPSSSRAFSSCRAGATTSLDPDRPVAQARRSRTRGPQGGRGHRGRR